jgi:hypothetical protein
MAFAQQMKKGLAPAFILALSLLSTAAIPELKRLPVIRLEEVRPLHPPGPLQMVPRVAAGEFAVVNFVHRAISVNGLLADQAYRLFAALVFLGIYGMRLLSSNRAIRAGLAAFALLGAGACLSDAISYWMLGGVVDWIGVSGHSAFSPSDFCWCLAPAGILLVVLLGFLTFNEPPIPDPVNPRILPALAMRDLAAVRPVYFLALRRLDESVQSRNIRCRRAVDDPVPHHERPGLHRHFSTTTKVMSSPCGVPAVNSSTTVKSFSLSA